MNYNDCTDDSESEFWLLVGKEGKVLLCSDAASAYGITPSSFGQQAIDPRDRPIFEDTLLCAEDFSVILRAMPQTGFAFAHICSEELVSSPVARVRLYREKSHVPHTAVRRKRRSSPIKEKTQRLRRVAADNSLSDSIRRDILSLTDDIERLSAGDELLLSLLHNKSDGTVFDAAAVFSRIRDSYHSIKTPPFSISFDDRLSDSIPLCSCSAGEFVGMCFVSSTVCAVLSRDSACRLSLSFDGNGIVLEAVSNSSEEVGFTGRACSISVIEGPLSPYPTEIFLAEQLSVLEGCTFIIDRRPTGRLSLCFSIDRPRDPYRFKYRDPISNADSVIALYTEHLSHLLPDPKKK